MEKFINEKIEFWKIKEMECKKNQRTRYTYIEKNNCGESLIIELIHCEANTKIAKIWKEKGYIKEDLKSWVSIETYVIDKNGSCLGKYNPQILRNTHKINFEWVIEDTEENREKIIDEILKRFYEDDFIKSELLNINGITKVDIDKSNAEELKQIYFVIDYKITKNGIEYYNEVNNLKKTIIEILQANNYRIELEEFEDNDTYFYVVTNI